MKNLILRLLLFLLPVMILGSSCSNTRFLAKDEALYTGSKITVEHPEFSKKQIKNLEEEISEIIRPKRNRSFLGLRFKLWVYNMSGNPKTEFGLRPWLKNKIGEPPVLGSDFSLKTNNKIIENYLQNRGYFSALSQGDVSIKRKKLKASFVVQPGIQDTIRKVVFVTEGNDAAGISQKILSIAEHSLLKKGHPYSLDTIIMERERIANFLRNKGYYYFNPDYIIVEADTGVEGHQLDLFISLKTQEIPDRALYPYKINKVTIIPNYRMNIRTDSRVGGNNSQQGVYRRYRGADTTYYPQGYGIVERQKTFRPYIFHQAMQLKPGDYYSLRAQNMALNRLINIGAFRFIKNEFTEKDSISRLLDLTYYLSPNPRKTLSYDIGAFSQNDSRVGSRAGISWTNNNTFRGAEKLSLKLTGGFDMQYGGEIKTPNIYNFGADLSLTFPKFVVPFIHIKPSSYFVPKTVITTAFNYSLGKEYYKISSLSSGIGYYWKEEATKDHRFLPINISYVKTDTLDISKANEFNLNNLTFNGLIIGPTYEYTFNTQLGNKIRKDNFYLNAKAELSGNTIGLAQGASLNEAPKKILGLQYAQFIKIESDFRHYHHFTKEKIFATRVFGGVGFTYGNSKSLPNIKQFFSGGGSSLRGFPSRLVGPGGYRFSKKDNNDIYIEMLGDIKLELNTEYRFPIYQFIKGAVFADAGNIWLYRKNPDFPEGEISKNFLKQIAVDAGAGLRFDFSILALRLDLGFPVRKPWYREGYRWRFNDLNLLSKDWRDQNLFFNLAIGYPF